MSKLRPDRATPAFSTVTEDPEELASAVRTIVDALNIRDRRTRDVENSFVTVKDLVDVGLITYDGQNAQAVTSTGGAIADGDKGDITVASSGTVWTIDLATVTNAKLASMATATLKGRTTAGTGSPEDLTVTQATAMLNTFTTALKGLAPASGGGTANYLRADGTWTAPPGTGGVTFANPTALVGSTAVNGVATTVMRSDAAPAIDLTANYTYTGAWTFSRASTTSALTIYANATTWQCVLGFAGAAEFKMDIASSATGLGVYVTGTKYLAVTAGNVDIPAGTLTVASTSVRDGGILTSGTVAAARLPTFGTAAAGIVPLSGGGTTNYLRADGTWAAPVGTTYSVFTSVANGLAPLSGGGTANYLRADGTWAAPPGTANTAGNPTASLGLTAINGVAATYMRSDAAPALSVSIAPTWTATHNFTAATGMGVASPAAVLHLKAGTATASTAPLKFNSGTNLTTAEAGAVEYDGSLLYMTPTGTARALAQTAYYYRKNTVTNLTNATGAQSWLGLTNGVTLAANTIYEFESEFLLTTTSATNHIESIGFALTTATVTNIGYSVVRMPSSTAATAPWQAYLITATATAVTGNVSVSIVIYRIKGTMAIGTGGQVNPQITFGTAAPGAGSTISLGAWMSFTPIGATGGNVSIGTWA